MARLTGLEPATPGVTGRYSNRLSYNRAMDCHLSKPARPVNLETCISSWIKYGGVWGSALIGTQCQKECAEGALVCRMGKVARLTGLEPATPGVTGRYSNQLSYNRASGRDAPSRVTAPGRQADLETLAADFA